MGTFEIKVWGMSASATGNVAIVAMAIIVLVYLALRYHALFRRKS